MAMGRRNWKGKPREREAVYGNRRRIRGRRGKALMRKRAEKVERSFAHCYETGGLRRMHLRGHPNILKRLLIHAAGFNLGLLMRKLCGLGTPRGLAERLARLSAGFLGLLRPPRRLLTAISRPDRPFGRAWPEDGASSDKVFRGVGGLGREPYFNGLLGRCHR